MAASNAGRTGGGARREGARGLHVIRCYARRKARRGDTVVVIVTHARSAADEPLARLAKMVDGTKTFLMSLAMTLRPSAKRSIRI